MDCWQLIYKHHSILFLLVVFYIYKHHRGLFPCLGFYIYKHHRILFLCLGFYIYKHHRRLSLWLGLQIISNPRGTKACWFNTWNCFGVLLTISNNIVHFFGLEISVNPRGTKDHWVNPWIILEGYLSSSIKSARRKSQVSLCQNIYNLN